ncbi:5-formyltetrahydrofolate cyclo-ligase [Fonticula alba]|uniref:5-formyltetrahydrofolate cyclo-ligase n=1 Tax=Fonticula alba TaxID=691883 RepID=A0A058ZER2_FONAL|nr:5-formyltetrahydrofolate cyclo-ligase [Fonticula alba]KCV71942.1 5-formyltetrahydrofolate cyclo-ligase [Fonticula alba]|eukprot:XP_009493520.1 5-formyltetrahydrofolate cyclo-ligase [Fonticula alba]
MCSNAGPTLLARLLEQPEIPQARNVAIYCADAGEQRGEVDTDTLAATLLAAGKRLFVPYVWPPGATDAGGLASGCRMDMVRVRDLEAWRALPVGRWGIREPIIDRDTEFAYSAAGDPTPLDLIIMPGLGFDAQGGRIGFGRGYYDEYVRFCDRWADARGTPRPRLLAMCLPEQLVPETMPREEHDHRPVDRVILLPPRQMGPL